MYRCTDLEIDLENTQSVMHYVKNAFSKNKKLTIKTLDPAKQNVIGNAKEVRLLDGDGCDGMYNWNMCFFRSVRVILRS